jgi:hypothetical protein
MKLRSAGYVKRRSPPYIHDEKIQPDRTMANAVFDARFNGMHALLTFALVAMAAATAGCDAGMRPP